MRSLLIFAFTIAHLVLPGVVAAQAPPSGFHIEIIDGEGALNNIKGRIAREPIVQVEDKNHKRVVGAYVEFDTPATGPSGSFADGSTHFVTNTDEFGHAVAHGLRPNNAAGSFDIHVHVTYQGQSLGEAVIHQVNVSGQLAKLSKNLDSNAAPTAVEAGTLGIVVGSDFLVDGNSAPGKASLTSGAAIHTLAKTVQLYLYGGCEFLVAPHSAVSVAPGLVDLHNGSVRARNFGKCNITYAALIVAALEENTDAVVGTAGGKLQVAAFTGSLQVRAHDGSVVDTVRPGLISSFDKVPNAAGNTSAASIPAPSHLPLYYLALLGASLGGLGIAIETLAQPSHSSTSP